MRKRLRKERRLGPFRENIFGVRFSLRDGLAQDTNDEFLSRFLDGAIEANGLLCGVAAKARPGSSTFSWRDEAVHRRRNVPQSVRGWPSSRR
jgi:uncharacterized protein YggL (DUF469 family)